MVLLLSEVLRGVLRKRNIPRQSTPRQAFQGASNALSFLRGSGPLSIGVKLFSLKSELPTKGYNVDHGGEETQPQNYY